MLYFLKSLLIPFFISIILSYLLQPIVNILSKPPIRWCNKICHIDNEACCESFWTITKSKRHPYEVSLKKFFIKFDTFIK